MSWVWNPEKNAYVHNSGRPKYYCNRCRHVHYFVSKRGIKHMKYGEYPDFPFLPGREIGDIGIRDEAPELSIWVPENVQKSLDNFKEFRISEHITLKLERNRTNIYIDNILFRQCKYLLLNLTVDDIPEYDEIGSIDEAIEIYSRKNETNKMLLNPETEFMGHCSNLQAWVENDYNVNILHSRLSFPLLKQLMLSGDKKAVIVFKEVVADVLIKGGEKAIIYLLFDTNSDYLDMFSLEELEVLFDDIDIESQEILRKISKLINNKRIINKLKERGHINVDLVKRGWRGY